MGEEPIDHITSSGRGEPTLARNLGEMIQEIKKIRLSVGTVLEFEQGLILEITKVIKP